MGTLAFMPWITVAAPCCIGDFELCPTRVVVDEDDDEPEGEGWVDATEDGRRILSAYKEHGNRSIKSATLVRRIGHGWVDDLSEEEIDALFTLNEAVAFAGLSEREFFSRLKYWNRDTFQPVVQRFKQGDGGVALVSRRRDGGNTTYVPGSLHSHPKPEHVVQVTGMSVDHQRAALVLSEMGSPADFDRAIRSFNEANTDRSTVSQAHELVSTVSAFQRFFGVGSNVVEVIRAFVEAMGRVPNDPLVPQKPEVAARLLTARHGLRGLWIGDLCNLRGSVGHGHALSTYPSLWTAQEHLLIAAHLFPLLVKLQFDRRGSRPLTDLDSSGLAMLNRVLASADVFAERVDEDGDPEGFEWNGIRREAMRDGCRERALAAWTAAESTNGSKAPR